MAFGKNSAMTHTLDYLVGMKQVQPFRAVEGKTSPGSQQHLDNHCDIENASQDCLEPPLKPHPFNVLISEFQHKR